MGDFHMEDELAADKLSWEAVVWQLFEGDVEVWVADSGAVVDEDLLEGLCARVATDHPWVCAYPCVSVCLKDLRRISPDQPP